MNRELKFRVWDATGDRFMDVYSIDLLDQDYLSNPEYVIQQYTGLKDRKDKEIYEGDIVEYGMCGFGRPRGAVPYKEGSPYWTIKEAVVWDKLIQLRGLAYQKSLLIIGNVYENPELLTEIEYNYKTYLGECICCGRKD